MGGQQRLLAPCFDSQGPQASLGEEDVRTWECAQLRNPPSSSAGTTAHRATEMQLLLGSGDNHPKFLCGGSAASHSPAEHGWREGWLGVPGYLRLCWWRTPLLLCDTMGRKQDQTEWLRLTRTKPSTLPSPESSSLQQGPPFFQPCVPGIYEYSIFYSQF